MIESQIYQLEIYISQLKYASDPQIKDHDNDSYWLVGGGAFLLLFKRLGKGEA